MKDYYVEVNACHGVYKAHRPENAVHEMVIDAGYASILDAALQTEMTIDEYMDKFKVRLATQEEKEELK